MCVRVCVCVYVCVGTTTDGMWFKAASDDAIESSGFQLANLELDPFAVKQSSRASKPIPAPATRTPTAAAIPMVAAPEPAPVVAASVVSAPLVSASPAAGESDGEVAAEKMAEHRAERGKRLLGAAKDLEKAAHYEMESAKGRFDVRSLDVRSHKSMQPHSILSAMSDELKKLSHLNSDTTTKETAGASLDGTDVHAMAVETKKLDTLVRALKGGKTFEDITMTEQAHVPDGEGENVKLSDSSARSDLDTFFDGMSRLEKTDHDVGDTYDKLQTPQKIELKMQQKKIDQLEKLVLGLATSKSSLGVHSGRVGMGMQVKAQAVVRGNSAYASILHAAQQSELPELHARLDNTPQGLKGVNVKDWYNDRVEKASEDAMLVGNRFADRTAAAGLQYDDVPGFMNADEGGSQLASFALPTKVKCPACGFLPSCKVNPQSLGFSRATGTFGSYPSAQATGAQDAYGGGREDGSTHPAHTATLRQLDSGGIMQSQAPLWTELSGLLPASAHTRRMLDKGELAGSVEGGQMLASFALPPKAVAAPPPKCVCPHCKLGDEQVLAFLNLRKYPEWL